MTFNEFVDFIQKDVSKQEDMKDKIEETTKNNINRLKNFTTEENINKLKDTYAVITIVKCNNKIKPGKFKINVLETA